MKKLSVGSLFLTGAIAVSMHASGNAEATGSGEMTAEEQFASVEASCKRRAERLALEIDGQTLYQRLGEEDGVNILVDELLRLHYSNEILYPLLKEYSPDYLSNKLVPYMIEYTGGPRVYKGSPLPESHKALHLSNAHFLAGGNDLLQAMENLGYDQNLTQDTTCFIFSLRDQVVFN